MRKYITTQGDMWDNIALFLLDDESLMHLLIDANPQYRDVVVFPANCELAIPEIPRGQRVDFPPWRSRA
jgi:hypothetical protein